MSFAILPFIFLMGAEVVFAQSVPTFKSSTLVVPLEVTVTNSRGRACRNLEARNFKVLEDGKPQNVINFSTVPPGVDVTAILDVSTSMMGEVDAVAKAAQNLVLKARPEDRIRFVRLSGRGADTSMKDFSNDRVALLEAVTRIVNKDAPGGTTYLQETMSGVLEGIAQNNSGRPQVIILMSDGQDTASEGAMPNSSRVLSVLEPKIQNSFATVYTISPGGELIFPDNMSSESRERVRKMNEEGKAILSSLSSISGGRGFHFNYRDGVIRDQLTRIFDQIMTDVTNRYTLAYSPNRESDSNYRVHQIKVEIIGKDKCIARTRTSYSDRPEAAPSTGGTATRTTR